MLVSSPNIYVTGGRLQADFRPKIVQGVAKLSFRVVKNQVDIEIKSSEWKPVVRGFELLKVHPQRRRNTSWKIGQLEMAVFWEYFNTTYERKKPFMEILPGLNVFLLEADWGGLAQGKSHGWRHWPDSSGLQKEELKILHHLKTDAKSAQRLKFLEMRLGRKLQCYYMLGNWVEWKIMELTLGRLPLFAVPKGGITSRDEKLIISGTKLSLEANLNSGLRGRPEKIRKVINCADKLLQAGFLPSQSLGKMVEACWEIWPGWSSVHDGIEHWFIQEIYRTLKLTARAIYLEDESRK